MGSGQSTGGSHPAPWMYLPQLVRALEISISGSDNEMLTLTETDSAFRLEARRFGHGVGISQRGAQWMAAM